MNPCKVLIVEDELLVAIDIEANLERVGHEVVGIAVDYEEALAFSKKSSPDLVLMDIAIRGDRNGIAAARDIREHLQIPVVFLTANADEQTLAQARATGPYGFLTKPFRAEELTEAVRIAIDQHKSAKKLFASYRWITTVLDSLTDAVVATDRDGLVRYLNPAAEFLTGWTSVEADGRPIEEIYPLTDATGVRLEECLLRKALASGRFSGKSRFLLTTKAGHKVAIEDAASPIVEEGRAIGAVTVFLDISQRLEVERQQEIEIDRLEEQAQAATEALGQTRAELRALAANLMTTQEQERQRIARELHDDLGQRAAYLGILIDRAEQQSEGQGKTLRELRALAAELSTGLREVSHHLHPTIIADLGLSAALESLVEQEMTSGRSIAFTERNVPSSIPLDIATALYRIAQEGLRNAAKHAPGSRVQLTLSYVPGELQLQVQDDGPGFSPVKARHNGGLGLVSTQERARLIGGNLSLSTRPGGGTVLLVRVPLAD